MGLVLESHENGVSYTFIWIGYIYEHKEDKCKNNEGLLKPLKRGYRYILRWTEELIEYWKRKQPPNLERFHVRSQRRLLRCTA